MVVWILRRVRLIDVLARVVVVFERDAVEFGRARFLLVLRRDARLRSVHLQLQILELLLHVFERVLRLFADQSVFTFLFCVRGVVGETRRILQNAFLELNLRLERRYRFLLAVELTDQVLRILESGFYD